MRIASLCQWITHKHLFVIWILQVTDYFKVVTRIANKIANKKDI